MALIDDVKKVIGISTTAKDTDVADLILSAKLDLSISGVGIIDETDPLIKRAITLYCQSNLVQDNAIAERFANSYRMLKIHLSLSGDYQVVVVSV